MYFDSVLDTALQPIVNDTPEEITKWLKEHVEKYPTAIHSYRVCIGKTMQIVSLKKYLELRESVG